MSVHDWTRVDPAIFYGFQHLWITEIGRALNCGHLPSRFYALPDKTKAIAIRHVRTHRNVALVEIVSPGNKSNQSGLDAFVGKAREALAAGVHLLLVDLFPPSSLAPHGLHYAVRSEDCGPQFALPADKQLTCLAYIGGAGEAFLDLVAVGDKLPDMPLFLTRDQYVPLPLEATYQAAWEGMPAYWRDVLTTGAPPQ